MLVDKASECKCGFTFRNKVLNHTIYYFCIGVVWRTPFTWESNCSVP